MRQEKHNQNSRFRIFLSNLKPSRWKLRWRIAFYLLLYSGLILLFLWLSMVVFLNRIYQNIKINEIEKSTDEIVREIDSQDIDSIADQIAYNNDVCIMAFDTDTREVILSKDVIADCVIHNYLSINTPLGTVYNYLRIFDIYEQAKDADGYKIFKFNGKTDSFRKNFPEAVLPSEQRDSIICIATTQDKNGDNILIILNSVIAPVNATVKTIRSLIIWLSGILLIVTIMMASFISAKISRPISSLSKKAMELATGDYDVHFEAKGYGEINELADSLNYAAGELSKVDSLRSDLLANISHDLRTPLTLIAGYAEIMRDIPDENTVENLQIIIDESNRLKNLVSAALDISLLQSGAAKFEFSEFALTNCIESELTRYNKLRENEGYSIEFNYDSLVTVNGDRVKIMQALYNLVNNAINYSGTEKKITVSQTVFNKKVRISVTDTGEGIEEDKLPLIWDRYYKVDKTHKRAQVGTGLGLSIVKGIIEAHKGSYGVTSKLGEGSTFWFELDISSSELL